MANNYLLHGNGVEVEYIIGANPAFTALTFTQNGHTKKFKPAEITTDNTGVGRWSPWRCCGRSTPAAPDFGFFLPAGSGDARSKCPGDDDWRDRNLQRPGQHPAPSDDVAVRASARCGRRSGGAIGRGGDGLYSTAPCARAAGIMPAAQLFAGTRNVGSLGGVADRGAAGGCSAAADVMRALRGLRGTAACVDHADTAALALDWVEQGMDIGDDLHLVSAARHPLTAAAVRPVMKYRWKNANSTAMGSVAIVEAAIAAAHSGGRE